MKTIDYVYIGILVVCLAFSFCFSGLDLAYAGVNQLRLEKASEKGDKKAALALKYAKDFDSSIATILFGNDFVNIFASSIVTLLAIDIYKMHYPSGTNEDLASTIGSAALLLCLLMFGEISPKAIAKNHSYGFARNFAYFLKGCKIIFFPFVWPINKLTVLIASPVVDKAQESEDLLASDEELEAMVDDIEEQGIIDEDDSAFIHRSLDFKDTSCYEVLTPRVKVFCYDAEDSWKKLLDDENLTKHSRIPVYKGNVDNILGYIPVKSLLRAYVLKKGNVKLNDVLLPLVSVPRTMPISSAMAIMKEARHHILAVRDEFGGFEGIITMEDILEEVVGEIYDEYDEETQSAVKKLGRKKQYFVKGSINIFDFFDMFELDEDDLSEDYSTLSGWITDKLGRFPEEGDEFDYKNIEVLVSKVKGFVVEETFIKVHRVSEKD